MNISEKIAKLNYDRYQNFEFNKSNKLYSAIYSFAGEVYNGLDAKTLSNEELEFTNNNVRILSGLYGILRPFDQIHPYRLEMGTKLKNNKGNNLYDFWQDIITEKINEEKTDFIINLASNEYFNVINSKKISKNIITPLFYENKGGEYKTVMIYAKKARGMMTRYIVKNKITNWNNIKHFNSEDYIFNEELSNFDCKNKKIVFTRG